MRLVIFLSLALLSAPAYADPVSLVTAVYAFFVALTVVEVIALVAVTISIATTVYGSKQAKKQGRRVGAGAVAEDRFATQVTNESPHLYIYGRARVPARIVAVLTSGAKDEFKHIVCVFASHECDAFEDIFIDGKSLGVLDASGFPTSGDYVRTETSSRSQTVSGDSGIKFLSFTPSDPPLCVTTVQNEDIGWNNQQTLTQSVHYTWNSGDNFITVLIDQAGPIEVSANSVSSNSGVRVLRKLGLPNQTVESVTNSELGSLWPSTAVLADHTYAIVRINLNWPEFQRGLPSIDALLRGKKLYDPRTDTSYWSRNNALATYDYLIGPVCQVSSSDIPLADLITSSNTCDEVILPVGFGGPSLIRARYTFDGLVNSDRDPNEILEAMAESMAGFIDATTWSITAGKYVAPVLTLNQTDVVGSLTINPAFSDASISNGVKGRFVSRAANYLETEFKPYQDAVYRAADGYDVYLNRNYEFTDELSRVHNLNAILIEDIRNGFTIAAEFSHKAWGIKVGQRVAINMPFFGIPDNKVFRVIDKSYGYKSQVTLTLKEDDASIWDQSPAVLVDATPNSNLANPFYVAPITGLTGISNTSTLLKSSDGSISARLLMTWTAAVTASVFNGGEIELEWSQVGDTVWTGITLSGNSTSGYCDNVVDGYFYTVRIRGVNPYQNVKGDWRTHRLQAIGKSALPANVAGFTFAKVFNGIQFTWNPLAEVDYSRSIIHIEAVWSNATPPLFAGPGNKFLWYYPGPGTFTALIKHEDTSGNRSATAAPVTFTVSIDSLLSRAEKPDIILELEIILDEQSGIGARATAYGITTEKSAYDNSITGLVTYLNSLSPAYTDLNTDTVIVGTALRTAFYNVLIARQALLNKIAEIAGTRAVWNGVGSVPANIATAGDSPANPILNSDLVVNANGSLNAGSGAPNLGSIAGQITSGQFSDDFFILNADGDNITVEMRWNRTAGGWASIYWDGVNMTTNKPFIPQQLGINQIEASLPATPFAYQVCIVP